MHQALSDQSERERVKISQFESLFELVNGLLKIMKAPQNHKSVGLPYAENVFLLELQGKILIQNRD